MKTTVLIQINQCMTLKKLQINLLAYTENKPQYEEDNNDINLLST